MAVFDSMDYSAISLMYENVPDVAYSALMQHLEVDTVRKLKRFHLSAIELNPGKDVARDVVTTNNVKSAFEVRNEPTKHVYRLITNRHFTPPPDLYTPL